MNGMAQGPKGKTSGCKRDLTVSALVGPDTPLHRRQGQGSTAYTAYTRVDHFLHMLSLSSQIVLFTFPNPSDIRIQLRAVQLITIVLQQSDN
jgi:hypothetical protein